MAITYIKKIVPKVDQNNVVRSWLFGVTGTNDDNVTAYYDAVYLMPSDSEKQSFNYSQSEVAILFAKCDDIESLYDTVDKKITNIIAESSYDYNTSLT